SRGCHGADDAGLRVGLPLGLAWYGNEAAIVMRAFRTGFAILALLLTPVTTFAAEKVDLLLVLAADVSRSIDAQKFQLHREGYAAALANPRVLEVINSGANHRIAVTLVEWSGQSSQKVVIDWTMIDGAKAAQEFGDHLLEAPRSFADRTSIS